MGSRWLTKVQLGQEATAGTEVAATTVLRAPFATIEDMLNVQVIEEDVGIIGGEDRTIVPYKWGQLSIPQHPASFEQLPYFCTSLEKVVTGAADGAGSDKIYQYDVPYSAVADWQTYTVEAGDDQQEEQMLYGFFKSFQLSGKGEGPVLVQGTMIGQAVATGTFTGSVSVPTVEDIIFSKGALYLDAVSGSYGSTQVSNTLLSFDLTVAQIVLVKQSADGALTWDIVYRGPVEISGSLSYVHNASAVTERGNWRSETPRLMELKFTGSSVATAGTTYSAKTLIVDLPIKYIKFNAMENNDGLTVVGCDFISKYNSTIADRGKIIVVNELTSLT